MAQSLVVSAKGKGERTFSAQVTLEGILSVARGPFRRTPHKKIIVKAVDDDHSSYVAVSAKGNERTFIPDHQVTLACLLATVKGEFPRTPHKNIIVKVVVDND